MKISSLDQPPALPQPEQHPALPPPQQQQPALYPYTWQDEEFLEVLEVAKKILKNQFEKQLKAANKRKKWKMKQLISEKLINFQGF